MPTGKLMEGVLAAIAQFDNDQRAEKTTLGMKEASKRGRWTFPAVPKVGEFGAGTFTHRSQTTTSHSP